MQYKSPYKNINSRKFNTWCKYQKRIDTYGRGCAHECKYCYAKALLDFRGNWGAPLPANLGEIHYQIKKLSRYDIVRLGSMTDCFQPIEKQYRITYETIKLLNYYRINYLIVTKSSLVSSEEYLKIYDRNLAHFQISITSTDANNYEKASHPKKRIKSIKTLHKLGFDVSVRLSPLIEQYVDFNVINSIKCDKILVEFLKVNHWVRKNFDIDYSEYTVRYGGHDNLPLEKKISLVNKIIGFKKVTVGEYVSDHHEYFKHNVNHNKKDCCNLNIIERKIDKQLSIWKDYSKEII